MMNKKQLTAMLEKLGRIIDFFTKEDCSRKTENAAFIELGALHAWIDLELQGMEDEE